MVNSNISYYENLKEIGLGKNIARYKKLISNGDFQNIKVNELLAISRMLAIDPLELLKVRTSEDIETLVRIMAIKEHGKLFSAKSKKLSNGNTVAHGQTCLENSSVRAHEHYVLAYNYDRYKNIAARAGVHDVTECDTQHEAQNIAVREDTKISPCAQVTLSDNSADSESDENIPVRDTSVSNSENIANVTTSDNSENSDENSSACMSDTITSDDSVKGGISPIDMNVYHNVEEVNSMKSRELALREQYHDNPEDAAAAFVNIIKNGLSYYPSSYNGSNLCFLDYEGDEDSGTLAVYYSVFNRRGEYLFSEAYVASFKTEPEKEVNYFRKKFYDIVTPDMSFEFTEDERISESDFYYGVYRQYRLFGFKV